MSRISVRGFAVASATAVTTVGAAVGVASGDEQGGTGDLEVVAADATLLADIPAGTNAQLHTASLSLQAESQSIAADAATKKAAEESARLQAAESAAEKKAAAERKAQEKAEREAAEREAEEAASRSEQRSESTASASAPASADAPVQSSYTKAEIQSIARGIVAADQFQCFSNIVDHESGWDHTATNPSSGAYGLMQALPGSKMASAGADWQTNPATQIQWGVNYMEDRYGSPCGAWEFWQANNWY